MVHWHLHLVPFTSLYSSHFKMLSSGVLDGVITFALIIACNVKNSWEEAFTIFLPLSLLFIPSWCSKKKKKKILLTNVDTHEAHVPLKCRLLSPGKLPSASSHLRGSHCFHCYHCRLVFVCVEPHVNEITQCVAYTVWLLSLNIMVLSLICIVACFSSSF